MSLITYKKKILNVLLFGVLFSKYIIKCNICVGKYLFSYLNDVQKYTNINLNPSLNLITEYRKTNAPNVVYMLTSRSVIYNV